MVLKVLNILSEVCGAVTQQTGSHQGLDLMEKSAENVQVNVQTLDSIPTEKQCAILMFGFIKSGSCHSFTE
uniref:Uncharacterized protein n=1 Tax=Astatotilapia calliptera TaxID=8154 RepID=A0A3P8PZX8_ASTCA